MIFTDAEAADLKVWVIKKLEDISDADSDVLADYVLALIRADSAEPELQKSASDNLEDFLKENTAAFVNELFRALHSKSYLIGYVPPPVPPIAPQTSPISALPPGASPTFPQPDRIGTLSGSPGQSRKRSYNQRGEEDDNGTATTGREFKQMRRGRGRGGRENGMSGRGGRGGFSNQNGVGMQYQPNAQMSQPMDFTSFDPNEFGATLAAMQSMMPMLGSAPVNMQDQIQNGQKPKGKCHAFFEKGYCKRGNTCPYDHGSDRIVVPDQEYDPKNAVMSEMPMSPANPTSPNIIMGGTLSNGPPRGGSRGGRGDRGANPPRKTRANFSSSGPNFDRSNTTIVVEQIPEEKFEEQSVRNFFTEFGTIVEVTMMAYKRLALVKYDNYFAAKAAYESPKVIFDNRFVKVYWYKPDSLNKAPPNGQSTNAASPTTQEEPFDAEKFKRDQETAQKKLEEKKAAMKEQEEKRQTLERQKEELLARQAEEKKKLMEKLAAKGHSMDLDMTDATPATNTTIAAATTMNGEAATEKQDDPASEKTKALRAQLASLEAEAKSLGLDTALSDTSSPTWAPRGRGRGRGRGAPYRGYDPSFRGTYRGRGSIIRGRGGGGAYNLDNRPKKVAISSVQWDTAKDESLRQHLLTIGDFSSLEPSPESPSTTQIVTFKDRPTAEKFMLSAKQLQSALGSEKLELVWVKQASSSSLLPPPPPSMSSSIKFTGPSPGLDEDTQMGNGGGGAAAGAFTTAINGAGEDEGVGDGGDGGRGSKAEAADYDVAEEDFDVAE